MILLTYTLKANGTPLTPPLTPPSPTSKLKHMFAQAVQPTHAELVEEPLDTPPSLSDIVREETDHGRLIVRFLIDLMQGSLADAKPCHRLDAARQLLNLGSGPAARAFIAANTPGAQRRTPAPDAPLIPSLSRDPLHQDLAAVICEETDSTLR